NSAERRRTARVVNPIALSSCPQWPLQPDRRRRTVRMVRRRGFSDEAIYYVLLAAESAGGLGAARRAVCDVLFEQGTIGLVALPRHDLPPGAQLERLSPERH